MRHTRHGYWLEEAGRVEPAAVLSGAVSADVAVVGGGYLGLWTAWHLAEAGADVVVLEADLCGHGPSGRNGGFVSSLWDQLPGLEERFGRERALEVGRASAEASRRDRRVVRGAERRRVVPPRAAARDRDEPGAGRTPGARRRRLRGRRARRRVPGAVGRRRCRRSAPRRSFAAGWRCGRARRCSRRGSRSVCGSGCSSAASGSTSARRSCASASASRRTLGSVVGRRDRARGEQRDRGLSRASGVRWPSRRATSCSPSPSRTCSTSSAGPAARRSRTHARCCTTSARRPTAGSRSAGAAGGWATAHGRGRHWSWTRSRRAGADGRSSASSRSSPAGGSRTPGAGRSTSRPRTCRSSAPAGASITASASRATASARATSVAGSSPRSRSIGVTTPRGSRSSSRSRHGSRPSRSASSERSAIRHALVATDAAADAGRRPDPVTSLVASLPRRLGLHLPR